MRGDGDVIVYAFGCLFGTCNLTDKLFLAFGGNLSEQKQVAAVADDGAFWGAALNLGVLEQLGAGGGFDTQRHYVVVGLRAGGSAVDDGFGADGGASDYCADAAAECKAEDGGGQDADGVRFEFHRGFLS